MDLIAPNGNYGAQASIRDATYVARILGGSESEVHIEHPQLPLVYRLLSASLYGDFGVFAHWLDRAIAYDTVIACAVKEGHYDLAISLVVCFLYLEASDGFQTANSPGIRISEETSNIMLKMLSLPERPRLRFIGALEVFVQYFEKNDLCRKYLENYLPPSDSNVEYINAKTLRLSALSTIMSILGENYPKLSEKSKRILIEAQQKWTQFSGHIGTGTIQEWGGISAEFYKPIEHEIQERCKGMDSSDVIRQETNQSGKLTAAAWIQMFKKIAGNKASEDLREEISNAGILIDISSDPGLWVELSKASRMRNAGFHPNKFGEKEAVEFRSLILKKEEGLLVRLCRALK